MPSAAPELDLPFISVVVPTANRADVLRGCLETLLSQRYPADRYEIVVVENGSRDDTPLLMRSLVGARRGPQVRHVSLATADANAARNAGVRAARGDPICMVDDDALVPPGWLAAFAAGARRHPRADCLGGPVRTHPGAKLHRCPAHPTAGATFDEGTEDRAIGEVWGSNMAIRRASFDAVGPFSEGLRRAQEWEWEHRLLDRGGSIVYVAGAWLWHPGNPRTVREAFQRGLMVGRTRPTRSLRRARRDITEAAGHAVRARCRQGVTETALFAGRLCGTVAASLGGARGA